MKKLYPLLCFFLLLAVPQAKAQTCSFNLAQDTGCIPFPILATATDTSVVSRSWVLTTCSGVPVFASAPGFFPNFSYVPTTPGCYCLTLISTNQSGQPCTTQQCNILIADTAHFDSLSVSPSPFCAPQLVTLQMQNTAGCGTITNTAVQWGCGNITNYAGNPDSLTHIYSTLCNPQCYNVNVVVTNSCGCVSHGRLLNAVCVLPKPVADFSVDVSSGVCVNSLTSHFVASNLGPGFTYTWFVNNIQQQSSASINFTHTFPAALSCYDVKLIVANSTGCSDTLLRDDFICVYASPILSFTLNTTSQCIDSGQTYMLCAQNTSHPFSPNPMWRVSGGTPPVNLGPYFGDNVCFPLTNPGTYCVTLIGSYGPNCVDSVTICNFTLKRNPTPCFYASDTLSCMPNLCTTFTNCSNAPLGSTYIWNFGAGVLPNTTALENPGQICYNGLGTRTVSLTVTSPNGCVKSLVKTNYMIIDTVRPQFTVTNSSGCAPLSVTVQSTTTVHAGAPYYICAHEWWVYAHNTNTLIDHRFGSAFILTVTTPGCYDIKLQTTTCSLTITGPGCVNTTWDTSGICVGSPPVCTLVVNPDTMCFEADSVWFNLGGALCNANTYIVHFGDEASPNATTNFYQSPIHHMYEIAGEFDAWIIPVQNGCYGDTLFKHIVVLGPAANFNATTTCISGDTVSFHNTSTGANRYHWQFGCVADTFNTASPHLLLPHCDTCTVMLMATSDVTHCTHRKIEVIQTACAGVTASFSADTVGCSSKPMVFRNTTPGHLQGATYWDFGSGFSCCANWGDTITLTFVPGIYQVAMRFVAPGGCDDTAYKTIRVSSLHANFAPTAVCLPDSFRFYETSLDSTCLGCDSIVAWKWTFDGVTTSTAEFPVHYFPLGTHTVKLKVTNAYGCVDSITKVVTVGTAVYSSWSVDSTLCPGSTICIVNNTSSGVTLTEDWQFPGANITSYNGHNPPCLTYNTDGEFPLVYTVTGGSCYKSDTVMMHVCAPKLSGYLNDTAASCPPLAVCAVNTSQCVDELTDIYTWNFGVGEYLETNPCVFYSSPGCYPVSLSVVTDNGCRDTVLIGNVCIGGPYVSSFTVEPTLICACKDSVHFDIGTVGANDFSFVWGCSQGFVTGVGINPVGIPGNPTYLHYDVPYCLTGACLPQITLIDSSGCYVLTNLPMIYVDTPAVDFAINNSGVCLSGNVCFADATTYTLPDTSHTVQWLWDFGDPVDSDTSSEQNPCHYYTQPGFYQITLTVYSNAGCVRTITKQLVIHGYPHAAFSYAITDTCSTANVCFTDLSTADAPGTITHWQWCFGGGVCDTAGDYTCHEFASEGLYPVTLTAMDESGCTDDTTITVNVSSIHHLTARIGILSLADSCNATKVCLIDSSLAESAIVNHIWNVEGITINANTVCHTYSPAGTYFITLRVTDNKGCADTTTKAFTTNGNVIVADFAHATADGTVQFTNTSGGNYVSQSWSFGDGGSSSSPNPLHTYAGSGVYTVTLTITDAGGCVSVKTVSVSVIISALDNQLQNGLEVKIIPNPFSNFTTIQLIGAEGEFDFSLVNLLGEEVVSAQLINSEPFRLNRNKLSAGLYLFEIKQNQKLLQRGKLVAE